MLQVDWCHTKATWWNTRYIAMHHDVQLDAVPNVLGLTFWQNLDPLAQPPPLCKVCIRFTTSAATKQSRPLQLVLTPGAWHAEQQALTACSTYPIDIWPQPSCQDHKSI